MNKLLSIIKSSISDSLKPLLTETLYHGSKLTSILYIIKEIYLSLGQMKYFKSVINKGNIKWL